MSAASADEESLTAKPRRTRRPICKEESISPFLKFSLWTTRPPYPATISSTCSRAPPVTTRISFTPARWTVSITCPSTVVSPHGRSILGWPMRLAWPAARMRAEIMGCQVPGVKFQVPGVRSLPSRRKSRKRFGTMWAEQPSVSRASEVEGRRSEINLALQILQSFIIFGRIHIQ